MAASDYEWNVLLFDSPTTFADYLNDKESDPWILDSWQDTTANDGWCIMATFYRPRVAGE
jgi:hypothetical protein